MEVVRINQAVVGVRFGPTLQDDVVSSTSSAIERIHKSLFDQLDLRMMEVDLKGSEMCLVQLRIVAFLGSVGLLRFIQSCFLLSSHISHACLCHEYELLLLLVEDKLESFKVRFFLNREVV